MKATGTYGGRLYLNTLAFIRSGGMKKSHKIEYIDMIWIEKYDLKYKGRRVVRFKYVDDDHEVVKNYSRISMEQYLKRRLLPCEMVHHVDGNKLNDRLTNLNLTVGSRHNKKHLEIISPKDEMELKMVQCPKCMKVKVGQTWITTKGSRIHGTRFVVCNQCRSPKRGRR